MGWRVRVRLILPSRACSQPRLLQRSIRRKNTINVSGERRVGAGYRRGSSGGPLTSSSPCVVEQS